MRSVLVLVGLCGAVTTGCVSSAGAPLQPGGVRAAAADCPASGTCNVPVRVLFPAGTTNCYYDSDDASIDASASTDIAWKLQGPADHRFNFDPGPASVVVQPAAGYSYVNNTGQVFTLHHAPQSAGKDYVVSFAISAKTSSGMQACTAYFYSANPYIRNR